MAKKKKKDKWGRVAGGGKSNPTKSRLHRNQEQKDRNKSNYINYHKAYHKTW